MTIDFNRYKEFVAAVTSDASTNFVDFADRIVELDRQGDLALNDCLLLELELMLKVASFLRLLRR
jgi:hypothetical protein